MVHPPFGGLAVGELVCTIIIPGNVWYISHSKPSKNFTVSLQGYKVRKFLAANIPGITGNEIENVLK